MASTKKYWKSIAELQPGDELIQTLRDNEFVEEIPVDEFLGDKATLEASATSRRDFLKFVGFSTAAATLAACEGPVKKSIPYLVQPEQIRPGIANYYATSIADGYDFANILVKTREGRPIKIENNPDSKTGAGANARVNASILGLYDSLRARNPKTKGKDITWEILDAEVTAKLPEIASSGKEIVLLTQTYSSPSTAKLIGEFTQKFGNVRHVVYDAISEDAALDAFQSMYGMRALPDYDFSKAAVIVSFGADFLGDWQGGGYEKGYAQGRVPKNGTMSRHIQFEANMTLSGANADVRIPLTPSQQKIAFAKFYGYLAGVSVPGQLPEKVEEAVKKAAREVKTAGSKAVVLTGIPDRNAQMLALAINQSIASETLDTAAPKMIRQGNTQAVAALVADMQAGKIGALIISGVNPVYTLPNASDFITGLKNVSLSVTFSIKEDETALHTTHLAAAPHYLESWGDVEMKKGYFSLLQPTIRPLFNTRQFQDALLKWMGSAQTWYEYLKDSWQTAILNGASWNKALHDGVFAATAFPGLTDKLANEPAPAPSADASALANALANTSASGIELTLYPKTGMGDGSQANNPWLQEFPDPITRVSWDNYLTLSQADADEMGLKNYNVANGGLNGSYVNITANGVTVKNVPVLIQPGQAKGSAGFSFGYGRNAGLKPEMQTGVNAYPLYKDFNTVQTITLEKSSGVHEFACVQLHHTMMGRGDIVKETTLEIFNTKDAAVWNPVPQVSLNHQEVPATSADLWEEFDRSIGHHFNLSIDLNACTGCGACVIACHAENNVPVVGKAEVRKSRDMHWLRIDRYYSSEDTFAADHEKKENISGVAGSMTQFREMESAAANPQVAFQPVMCQHCNHAPCETVCPVAATSHSRQGQNHMAYNRCVGTRYCANNCPYKVRRFNWFLYNNNEEFDFYMNDDLGRMVLNPDVNVRSRGVMEKCSLCIQKTQKTILDAKREGRAIQDSEFQTACSEACTTGAMVFGDINDTESQVVQLKKSKRMYHLLEHVGTRPNVFYHVKVRNSEQEEYKLS